MKRIAIADTCAASSFQDALDAFSFSDEGAFEAREVVPAALTGMGCAGGGTLLGLLAPSQSFPVVPIGRAPTIAIGAILCGGLETRVAAKLLEEKGRAACVGRATSYLNQLDELHAILRSICEGADD